MGEQQFRLRINYQKLGPLRLLSHLELTRTLERTVRRAQLPYVVSQGFNPHMRYAPGPALPVGTESLDEYFDVILQEHVPVSEVLERLRVVSVSSVPICAVSYVDLKSKGLQATHIYEDYRILLDCGDLTKQELQDRLQEVIDRGELAVSRKQNTKVYDLKKTVRGCPEVLLDTNEQNLIVTIRLTATTQGSIRPELLIDAALSDVSSWKIHSITRIRLSDTID